MAAAIGNAQAPQHQWVENFVLPPETTWQKVKRIAVVFLASLSLVALLMVVACGCLGNLPEWDIPLFVAVLAGLVVVTYKLMKLSDRLRLSDPDQREDVLREAELLSFKKLLDQYSLRQMLHYRILPRGALVVKALRYLEKSVLKEETVSEELLDQLVQEEIITARQREFVDAGQHEFLRACRMVSEVALEPAVFQWIQERL